MKKLDVTVDKWFRGLFYGQPGSTKTRTAATAAMDPRMSPVLHLDIGGNTLSVRDYEVKPDIFEMDSLKEFNVIYDFLSKGQPDDHPMVKQMGAQVGYKTVIIDGITDVQRDAFNGVTGNAAKNPADLVPPRQIQHYGTVLAQMTQFARMFYKLEMHVIVTALEKEDRDEATGGIYYRPMLAGQAAGEVAAYAYTVARMMHAARVTKQDTRAVSETGFEGVGQAISVAVFQPSGRIMAKDQSGMKVPYMVDPTMTKMLDLIERNTRG